MKRTLEWIITDDDKFIFVLDPVSVSICLFLCFSCFSRCSIPRPLTRCSERANGAISHPEIDQAWFLIIGNIRPAAATLSHDDALLIPSFLSPLCSDDASKRLEPRGVRGRLSGGVTMGPQSLVYRRDLVTFPISYVIETPRWFVISRGGRSSDTS